MKGRPKTKYSAGLADEIVGRIAAGEPLTQVCREEGMPNAATVHRWVLQDLDGLGERYREARRLFCWGVVDEIVSLADGALEKATGAPGTGEAGARVQAIKLKVDARQWLLAKMLPEDFGESLRIEHAGPGEAVAKPRGADEAADYIGRLIEGWKEYRDSEGEPVPLDEDGMKSLAGVLADFVAGEREIEHDPEEVGKQIARIRAVRGRMKAPAGHENRED